MTNPFAAVISFLLDGYKKAHGKPGPPENPELKTALYEAATFLEAAGKVDKAKCFIRCGSLIDGPQELYNLIAALPDAPGEERREMVRWMDELSDFRAWTWEPWQADAHDKIRALILAPPVPRKVSVTRGEVANVIESCADGMVAWRTQVISDWLREAGIEVIEKP